MRGTYKDIKIRLQLTQARTRVYFGVYFGVLWFIWYLDLWIDFYKFVLDRDLCDERVKIEDKDESIVHIGPHMAEFE